VGQAHTQLAITCLWWAWALIWLALSLARMSDARREPAWQRVAYIAPLVAAIVLNASMPGPGGLLVGQVFPYQSIAGVAGVALSLFSLAFSVWARLALGRNWSGTVTIKQDHQLVTCGPYRIARHPIYLGMLMMFVGNAIGLGQWRTILALALFLAAIVPKLRKEERWMEEHFGDAYRGYAHRTAALVPFLY